MTSGDDERAATKNLSHEEIIGLIGDNGVNAFNEIADQFPEIFQGMSPESFLSIYNAAFLLGFRNAEIIYRTRMLEVALDIGADEDTE